MEVLTGGSTYCSALHIFIFMSRSILVIIVAAQLACAKGHMHENVSPRVCTYSQWKCFVHIKQRWTDETKRAAMLSRLGKRAVKVKTYKLKNNNISA